MKLGLSLGAWSAQPPTGVGSAVAAAEELGYEAVFTSENYGSDAFTPLSWWGGQTSRIKLGTAVAALYARSPTVTAMSALTLDHLSGGRHILGLGVSGPLVVEGWYGQPFDQPLSRTRECVDIIRQVLARAEPVTSTGPHYPLPYGGAGARGLGKPLKPIVHPLRDDLPIWLGAEGPKNIALCAEIADGWLPMFFAPRAADMYRSWLDEGFARPGARRSRSTFQIAASCKLIVTADEASTENALDRMRDSVAFYIGGMGGREMNFHKDLFTRLGYGSEADEVQRLFLEGDRGAARAAVPRAAVQDISLIGTAAEVRDRLAMWEEAGVSMLIVAPSDEHQLRLLAETVLGR